MRDGPGRGVECVDCRGRKCGYYSGIEVNIRQSPVDVVGIARQDKSSIFLVVCLRIHDHDDYLFKKTPYKKAFNGTGGRRVCLIKYTFGMGLLLRGSES